MPQLYLTSIAGAPVRRLVGFDSVALAPGETRTVSFDLDPRLLAGWADGGWTIVPGRYGFALGDSADSLGSTVERALPGRRLAAGSLRK